MWPGVKHLIIMFFALLYTCNYNKIILSYLIEPGILILRVLRHGFLILGRNVTAFVMKKDGGSVVVDLLFCVSPIVCGGTVLVFVLVCITLCLL